MWLLCSFQGPPRGAPDGTRRKRSLKTQQHARARAPRSVAPRESAVGAPVGERRLARPGSVDVLGRTVGGQWLASIASSEDEAMAGHGAVPYGSLVRDSLERR